MDTLLYGELCSTARPYLCGASRPHAAGDPRAPGARRWRLRERARAAVRHQTAGGNEAPRRARRGWAHHALQGGTGRHGAAIPETHAVRFGVVAPLRALLVGP